MFERLFHYPGVLTRHREAPLLAERENFLQHCADQGMAQSTLTHVANELLIIVRRLDVSTAERPITRQQIEVAAERWARHQRRRGRCHGLRWSRERFTRTATAWLGFIGRLEVCEPKHSAGEEWLVTFAAYLQEGWCLFGYSICASGL